MKGWQLMLHTMALPVDVVPDRDLGAASRRQGTGGWNELACFRHGHRRASFRDPRGGDGQHHDEVGDSPHRHPQPPAIVFRDATAARKVGRCMAVHRESKLHWWDKARFLSVLRRCAASGNPEASYILGLDEFCNRKRKTSGLRHLRRAMEHGHAAAAYMIGMITLHDSRSPDGTEQALERLEWFSASSSSGPRTRSRITSVGREAVSVVRRVTMRRWRMAAPPTPCTNPWCGVLETEAAEGWDDGDDEERRFCSRTCRWKHEYCKFMENI